ncbi:MAG: hypothetical protein IT302_14230 [Dehalococcoidia bacterium]|nr:hypothetical protein [Dehalococcoidia bacterium]
MARAFPLPRGPLRIPLIGGAAAVAVMVVLMAWLLRPGGGPSPAKPNAWVPGAGSVEWMRIERARPGSTPLTDLNSLNPGARPVMEMVLAWLRDAPVVAGAPPDALLPNGDILRMRVGEGRIITVARAQDCVARTDTVVGAPWSCTPAPGFVSIADETTASGGAVIRLDAPALDAWLDTGWQADIPAGSREPHPGGIPAADAIVRGTLTTGSLLGGRELDVDTPAGALVLAKLGTWLAESTLTGAEPEWNIPGLGSTTLVLEERGGETTALMPAYDCAIERGPGGTVAASTCAGSREFVVLVPAPGRGEPARLWSPALAAWLAGG